jgi:hypothetical protein
MIFKKHCFKMALAAALFAAPQVALSALAAVESGPRPPDSITTVRLHVQPKAEPKPALRYRFDFPFMKQRPGNAALQYNTALSSLIDAKGSEPMAGDSTWTEWLKARPAEIPTEEANRFVSRFAKAIEYAELAATCESCDWQYPIRERGMGTLMPGLSDMRFLWRILALKTRLDANADNIPEALRSLRIGFTMATHLGNARLLIHDLVAANGAAIMLDQVEALIENPRSPNLYWALTSLPEPLIDYKQAVKVESESMYAEFPELATLDERVLSDEEVVRIWQKLAGMMSVWMSVWETPSSPLAARMLQAVEALKQYPAAKQWLRDQGLSAEAIDAMPPLYVVLRHENYHFTCLRDDVCKWFSVPYWQAAGRFQEAQDRIDAATRNGQPGGALANTLSAFARVGYLRARLERDLAILRCVEAIRIYGAAHNGQFPPSLDDISEVPVPLDPLYGRAFSYELRDGMAVLESPAPSGQRLRDGMRYEIVFE